MKEERTAFVAIVGRPNVGKSSIMNRLLGQKVAIVSDKPQTTRTRIMGVLTEGALQMVFVDTPGLHKPRTTLGKNMVKAVSDGMTDVEACLLVVEAGARVSPADQELASRFASRRLPAVLAINKIDLLENKRELLSQIMAYSALYDFAAVVPVSAQTGEGLDELLDELRPFAQPGPHMFDEDTLTDQPERVIAGELLREKLLQLLQREVPHGIAIAIERFRDREDGILDIEAVIYCEKESHKGIVIGMGGATLKKAASLARKDMEAFFDCQVNLQCWVKVREGWRNRQGVIHTLGLD